MCSINNEKKKKKINYLNLDIDDELNDFLIKDAKEALRAKKHHAKYILRLYMNNKKGIS